VRTPILFRESHRQAAFRALAFLVSSLCAVATTAQESPNNDHVGKVHVEVTNILATPLPAELVLRSPEDVFRFDLPNGSLDATVPAGTYRAWLYVLDRNIPILVDIVEVRVAKNETASLVHELLEGSGNRSLRAFDRDEDLVLDRLELREDIGTDPEDAASLPGEIPVPFPDRVLSKKAGWYRGELHAYSTHSRGTEPVKALVRRAEKAGLDFLAITDRNSMAAAFDKDFASKKIVLLPAMEWGNDAKGYALFYGPATLPPMTQSLSMAQAIATRVQRQGGVVAVARPCFPNMPWQWGLSYVNAIEVWCREWRKVPPMWPELLDSLFREEREEDGTLTYSIARAAFTRGLSANGQAAVFWDQELNGGLQASVIAGSASASPDVPLGAPITYVYAQEKSAKGILDGLRRGFTLVSKGPDGPLVRFCADVLRDGRIDTNVQGVIPLDVDTRFLISVERAKGHKMQVLRNGRVIASYRIPKDKYLFSLSDHPERYSVYRVRVVKAATEEGFGALEVLAMTSPIYAQVMIPGMAVDDAWIAIDGSYFGDGGGVDVELPTNPEAYEVSAPRF
jgi:hypothetical protein